ncbi:DUF6923 family protein [Chiayiivirga flava]|uniref:Streptogramin lyase n=1 Tax=Chiayiivirga flava TaxID=659595 RepID=A0A7W8G0K8_9GAMM|nr:hypothetical protein [Chiayiivirga flava]MBB5209602.1 streptogramin lyase [Chiayiivirga flava]
MRPLHGRLLAGLLACVSTAALAEPVGYAVGFDSLYRIDLGTGQATLVGPLGYIDVEGLAISPGGQLFAVADAGAVPPANDQTDFLLRIDPATGTATAVGQMTALAGAGTGTFGELDYGLAFTCSGQLWLSSDTTGQLWEVDPDTAQTRPVGTIGAAISGLAGRGDALYGLSIDGNETLYRISTATAQATAIGPIGLPDRVFDAGLDFDGAGRLWATIDYLTPPTGIPPLRNDIARLDPMTGAVLELRIVNGAGTDIDTVQMEGLAVAAPGGCGPRFLPQPNEIPGPSLPLLLVLGAVLALAGRRALIA